MPTLQNPGNVFPAVAIANGQSESEVIDMRGSTFTGFIAPVALDGASVTFLGSIDGENFFTVIGSDGVNVAVYMNGAGMYKVNPVNFLGISMLKIKAASNQTAARSLTALGGDYTN